MAKKKCGEMWRTYRAMRREEDNERAKHVYFKLGFTQAIDRGYGDELDPSDYTLYLRKV